MMGFFYRTIRMVDHGIKPCYIFDGKPPELKGGVVSYLRPVGLLELTSSWPSDLHCGKRQRRAKRKRRRRVGCMDTSLNGELTPGTAEDIDKLARRQVRVTKEHNEECKKLLALMGIPVVTVRRVRTALVCS